MGQQQLLLVVLGIIVVGIAIFVGFFLLSSNKADHNRQAVISDLLNFGLFKSSFCMIIYNPGVTTDLNVEDSHTIGRSLERLFMKKIIALFRPSLLD